MDFVGKSIGNYQIREELGRGGMAVVYRAYQPSLNREVAIKVLPPQLGLDRQFVERFQREARSAASLRHPNIVVIHDVGHESGVYYIVMEMLEGRTLRTLIEEEGRVVPRRATRIAEQVAEALDYAHQRGFVHRDVKPSNIFIGDNDHVTLTDFGIAKAASETQQLTRTGMLMGTPEYMSPEQAEGGTIDHRTDLYALGVVVYQMLVGRVPFTGTTPHATLHAVIYETPPPPRRINPDLSADLEAVVLKSVSKQAEARYQSGAELSRALKGAMAGRTQPVAAPSATRRRPAQRRVERGSPLLWILGGIAAVLVLTLGGVLLLRGGNGESTPESSLQTATQGTPAVGEVQTPTDIGLASSVPPASPSGPTASPVGTLSPTTEVPATEPPAASNTPAPPSPTPPPSATAVPPASPTVAASFGRLAFTSNRDGDPEIFVIDLATGQTSKLTKNNANDWLPDWSPDGSRLAFTSARTGSYDLWVMNGDGSGQSPWVTTGAWDEYARWAPDGQRLSLSTTANTQGVPNSEIFVRQANGNLTQITFSTAEDQWADWSPEGRIAFAEGFQDGSDWDIYVVNADGSGRSAWLDEASCDVQPSWSPDGAWIAFVRISNDTNGNGRVDFEDAGSVWVGSASGGGLRRLTSGMWASTPAWSPDGAWIAFGRARDSNGNGRLDENDDSGIWAVPASGGDVVPLIDGPNRDGNPTWTW
jgi:serine/threonine protein kinase